MIEFLTQGMAWLTGKEIHKQVKLGRIRVEPFDEAQCNPGSYDYRLGDTLRILKCNSVVNGVLHMDPRKPMAYDEVKIPKNGYMLEPGKAYLGTTVEKMGSNFYPWFVTGKSSLGRLFIENHVCAGLVDVGFFNNLTLEIKAQLPVLVFPNMRFGQAIWFEHVGEIELYKGKYGADQGSNAAEPSRSYLDWNI